MYIRSFKILEKICYFHSDDDKWNSTMFLYCTSETKAAPPPASAPGSVISLSKQIPTVHLITVFNDGPGFLLYCSPLFQTPAPLFFMTFCLAVTATSITCGYSICGIPSSLGCSWSKSGMKWGGILLDGQTSLHPTCQPAPNARNLRERNKTKQTKTAAPCQGATFVSLTFRGKQPCEPSSSLLRALSCSTEEEGTPAGWTEAPLDWQQLL